LAPPIAAVHLDQSPIPIPVTVTPVNDPPSPTGRSSAPLEDTAFAFAAADFGFSDPLDSPANTLLAVKITTLPDLGTLTDNGVAVTAGQFIAAANITGGKFKYLPPANANGSPFTTFTFQVQDNGGTANGGVDLDQSPNTITINVTPVKDPPSGTDKTVTNLADTAFTFPAPHLDFS